MTCGRGAHSPYAYVEYTVEHLTIQVPVFGVLEIEEAAELLADGVRKHFPNLPDEAEKAYRAAVWQLTNKDFNAEWEELQRKKRRFQRWGNKQVPEMVLVPDEIDPREWKLITVNQEGEAFLTPMRPQQHKLWRKEIPGPQHNPKLVVKGPDGWYTKPVPKLPLTKPKDPP